MVGDIARMYLVVDEAGILFPLLALLAGFAFPRLRCIASYLAGVQVDEVKGVARELETAGNLALDEVGVLGALKKS